MEEYPVWVDSREPETIEIELKRRGVPVVRKTLEAGDVAFSSYIFERKTVKDFYASLISQRLWEQAAGLKGQENPSLVLTGPSLEEIEIPKGNKRIFLNVKNSVIGAISAIEVAFGIPVKYFPSDSLFLDYIVSKYNKAVKGEPTIRPVKRLRALSDQDLKENILRQFRGIGQVAARRILEAYDNHILEIALQEPKAIKGVKPELIQKIKKILAE